MPKLMRKRAILAKIESVYGTDPTPTGSSNAIQVRNLNISPIAADSVARDLIRPYLGESDQLIANKHVEVDFEVELAGSGALGTAPAYGPLLRACAMAETVTASTKVEYLPISASFESVTIYTNVDGVLHKITGARGTWDIELVSGQIPVLKFKFVGIYNAPTDTALPTAVYTGFQKPLAANKSNTTGFSLFSVSSFVLEQLMISLGNTVDFRALIGDEYTQINDRRSSGDISFEATALATFDAFATRVAGTTGSLSITHGTADGNKVKIDAPVVSLGNMTYADSKGVVMVKSPLLFLPSSGNDELKLTFI